MSDTVCVIIPTAAMKERARDLARAIESLHGQSNVRAVPIVVVNGPRRDRGIVEYLRSRSDIRLLEQEEGNLPRALVAGRRCVDTEYFGVLDDDDEYLPHALSTRKAILDADGETDVVATSGLRCVDGIDRPYLPTIENYRDDPLAALMEENWLASCGALYRSQSIGPEMLVEMPRYLEWTYLAFLLCLRKKIAFSAAATYRIHANSVGSLSNSWAYALQLPIVLNRICALDLPRNIRSGLKRKRVDALHSLSNMELRRKNYRSAWLFHLRCLGTLHGLRYLSYTRHLLTGCPS